MTAKTKKTLLTGLFILFNIGIILWAGLSEINESRDAANFTTIEIRWSLLIPAVLCFIIAIAAEISKYAFIMKLTCDKVNWKIASRTVLIGRYYDNITPAAVGGQAFQIYYMNRHGVPPAQSAAVPVAGFMSMQLSFILLALGVFLFRDPWTMPSGFCVLSYIGLLFFGFFPLLILFTTFFPHAFSKLLSFCMRILSHLKIIRGVEAKIEKTNRTVQEYSKTIGTLLKNPLKWGGIMLLGLIYQFALNSIPYFVILAFGGEISFSFCFITTVTIASAIAFIPTPGNAGAAEGSFYLIFSFLTAGYTFWAMLVWRFFNYYIFILMGLLISIEMSVTKKKAQAEEPEKIAETE